jgi:hypothetical protein
MRKIERLMNRAIANHKDWQLANTRVEHEDDLAKVYLHGHKIAEIGEGFITLWDGGYQSATTKSRLNAILRENGKGDEGVYQKNFRWKIFYDGKVEDFVSGMTI